uniref:CCHC-type domain-containing protein n=1 Tax=Tanacetum cinerariifolium TaxID=118510 RepID=A0A6L2KLZ2_TANCI|nr:hypothetical protein [Tanacetum cinerariifolium]
MTAGLSRQCTSGSSGTSGNQRVIMCYNCKGEGHMSKLCTKPKRKRGEAWFKDKIALMANLSHYGSDNLAEVHNQDNVINNLIDQDVQATSTSEQSNILNQLETEITSDSNIISYSQYMNESQYTTVQNLSSHALQDDLILSVIEQLKTQVVSFTKINQDNKNVNDFLTAELKRYKDQVKILKEQNNVDKASESCAQSLEIDNLKHILSEHLKEKESLEQKVTLLKNDFQKEESRNIDRELALEKQKTDAIVIHDSEETLMLEDESRSKMLQKQKDPKMSEKKVITIPVDYVALNQLSKDFETCFVPQTKLSIEQAFLSRYSVNSEEPNLSSSTTIVEVLKKLPKVNMVNSSLKKLKFYLSSFDVAVEQHCVKKNKFQDKMKDVLKENERLLAQAISVDIVNIVVHDNVNYACKTVNDCARCVTIESELQKNFIEKECYDKNNSFAQQSAPNFDQLFEINDLKAQSQEKDTIIMKLKKRLKSLSGNVKEEKIKRELEEIETINIELDHRVTTLVAENEHSKQNYKQLYDLIKSSRVRSKEQCEDLIKQVNIKSAKNSDLNASLQKKVLVITALKETLSKLKGKAIVNVLALKSRTRMSSVYKY